MQKAKKYDWKDSNMALFGSDTDKKVKKESAQQEKAWSQIATLGDKEGTVIFRINKFKVELWPKEQYGEFYNGDSYIIFHQAPTEENPDELKMDLHFWIGKYSTQDEYGTAAYKTVELDTFMDDKPIQHREVQGYESPLFKTYFPTLTLLKGGADTGFRRVLPESYTPRLLHIRKQSNKRITCTEVSLKRSNLTSEDVFVIDHGHTIYQWNGKSCSHDEKFKAAQEVNNIKGARGKAKSETLDEDETREDHVAFDVLKEGQKKPKPDIKGERKMLRLRASDADGQLKMEDIGEPNKGGLDPNDVFIINTGTHCYCWIGKGASIDERRNGLSYASNYLNKTETPWLPISVVAQGKETSAFNSAF